jgi:hypothetical protein
LSGAAALLGLTLGLAVAIAPAAADKVGVAAAVNPDAFSSLAGSPQSQLSIGKSIFYNERINTTGSGLVQVLLVDGSTFTVGPGSDLVIDKFVYDPKKGVGQISASFSKGVMRFVGGKISKNEGGVSVDTPAGALAIRGGMVQGNGKVWSFLYGVQMTLKGNNGKTYTVYEPGYTLDLSGGTPNIRPTTSADVNSLMAALTNSNTGGLNNSTETQSGNQVQVAETLSLQDLVAEATAEQVDSTLTKEETTPTEPTDPGSPQVTARVLVGAGVYTAFPETPDQFTTDEASDAGILGGDLNSTVDDFIWTFNIENNRLVGTVSGLTDAHCMNGDCSNPENIVTNTPPAVAVNLPAAFQPEECELGVCAVTNATLTQDGEPTTYVGLAVLKKDFFAYHLVNAPPEPSGPLTNALDYGESDYHPEPFLAFGGKGYNFGTPSGKTYAFALTPDVKEEIVNGGAIGPFAGAGSSPFVDTSKDSQGNFIKPQPAISPLLYLEKDSGAANDPSRAVWLQTGLYINTTPADPETYTEFDQQSWVNVALGGVENGGLVGERRGGAAVDFDYEVCQSNECWTDTRREAFAFTGDIASLKGPDGSHFMGSNEPNMVIGFDSTGTHNIGRDSPLDPDRSSVEDQSGSTYHIGVGLGTLPAQDQTLNGEYKGYATGIVQSEVPQGGFANVVASRSPDDFGITFDNTSNTLAASLSVYDVQHTDSATGRYTLGFGDDGESSGNKSAYIDNLHYAAIENGNNEVSNWNGEGFTTYETTAATSYLVSGEQLGVTQFFPDTFEADPETGHRPFCANCEFIQWGAWGTRVGFGTESASEYVDNVHLGWWIAGNLTADENFSDDVDVFTALGPVANYTGSAIGNVASYNTQTYSWSTYVAAGDAAMSWSFANRSGALDITNFDGNRSFNYSLNQVPGPTDGTYLNRFGGGITNYGWNGQANGSFVDKGSDLARGAIGNWNAATDNYKATGIFGVTR